MLFLLYLLSILHNRDQVLNKNKSRIDAIDEPVEKSQVHLTSFIRSLQFYRRLEWKKKMIVGRVERN